MTSIMRRTVRRSAVTLGAVALAFGAAACGGSSEAESGDSGEDTSTSEEAAEDESTAAEEDTAAEEESSTEQESASEAESAEGSEALSEEDLAAAEERFLEFLQVADDGDHEVTCGYVLDPSTGEPAEGAFVEGCAEGMTGSMGDVEPGTFDSLTVDDIEASDNGDGTVAIAFMGTDFPLDMTQGSDGEWYIDGSM